ncbi:hypothetical protein N3K66_008518 [Trichothecium roseum]|uniref:Uncharacterized protein n=1 Tax=Trichothecium roseum TaxID=47278 RepID=A0ACC0UQK9_9HYPO|nr:hypothetical protein N3K66_008518 [Trichothecium roseum]
MSGDMLEKRGPESVGDSQRPGSDPEKSAQSSSANEVRPGEGYDSDDRSEEYQGGVQRVRAVTTLWSKKTLWIMFGVLYLVSFCDMLLVSIQSSLNPYITSSFGKHGLLATTTIVSSIISGCSRLPLSKIMDVWGRAWGFLIMLLISTVGLIMKSTCRDVQTYLGAHVLYWTGHIGLMYVIDVMLSDMTTLKNRMVMLSVTGTPTIASTFLGPRIAQAFYDNINFRWAYGSFAIIVVAVSVPVIAILVSYERRASREGLITKENHGRNWYQQIYHVVVQLDLLGILLVTAAFALILLPFSLVSQAPNGWKTPYIPAMVATGVVVLGLFYLWEAFFAPVTFLPWKYLKEPTILGSCLLYAVMFTSTYCWNNYFSSYLQVVHRLSITTSGYVLNAYMLSSAIISPLVAGAISYFGDYKWTAYIGVPTMLLGTGLLIPFRTPDTHIGLVTLTQVLVGIGSGLFTTCAQVAVMAVVSHQEVAVVLAIWGMFGSIGAALGLAIAGGIWNNILPHQLMVRLPEEDKADYMSIFGDLVQQMAYPDGSDGREAVVGAYAFVQRRMVIAGAALMPLCALSIFVWKNVNLKRLEREKGAQTKGNVW